MTIFLYVVIGVVSLALIVAVWLLYWLAKIVSAGFQCLIWIGEAYSKQQRERM